MNPISVAILFAILVAVIYMTGGTGGLNEILPAFDSALNNLTGFISGNYTNETISIKPIKINMSVNQTNSSYPSTS